METLGPFLFMKRAILQRASTKKFYIKEKGFVGATMKEATKLTKAEYQFVRAMYPVAMLRWLVD